MPRYKYVCGRCSHNEVIELPISCSPKKIFCCSDCGVGNMTRRIIGSNSIAVKRETLGEWYKKNTGKDFLG